MQSWASPLVMLDFKDPAASFEKSSWNVTGSVDFQCPWSKHHVTLEKSKNASKHVISQQMLLVKQLLLFKFFFMKLSDSTG